MGVCVEVNRLLKRTGTEGEGAHEEEEYVQLILPRLLLTVWMV